MKTLTLSFLAASVCISPLLVLAACGPEDEAEAMEGADTAEPVVGVSRSALTAVRTFTWNQDQGHDTVMLSSNEYYCFLTKVGGRFSGGGEYVRIDRSNGTWIITGGSAQNSVNATATCVSWEALDNGRGGSFGWNMAETSIGPHCEGWPEICGQVIAVGFVEIAPITAWCTLSGIRGALNGSGEAAQVRVTNNRWDIQGSCLAHDNFTQGLAQCVQLPAGQQAWVSRDFVWSQGNAPIDLGTAADRVCALASIEGNFAGGGEHVEVYQLGSEWILTGGSQQSGVKARARCTKLHQ